VRRRILLYGGIVVCSAATVALIAWAFSRPHRPLEYMVAGTFSTALVLLGTFFVIVKRRLI
jgi:hypothetical protein